MKKLLALLACLLLVGGAAVWYFMRGGDKARNILPADAAAVCVFEPIEFVRELGLTLKEIRELSSPLGERWSHAVNFAKPVYAFVSPNGLKGVALNVKNADKLLNLISAYGFASEQKDGFRWVMNKNSIGCLDDDKMLVCVLVPPAQQDALRDEMMKLMSQGKHSVPILDRAKKQKGALKFSSSLGTLPKEYLQFFPFEADLSGVFLDAAFRIGKQDATLSLGVSEVPNPMPFAPINGDLAPTLPEEPFFWLCGGVKGEQLLSLLRKVSKVRMALIGLNMFIDADMMIRAIDGDVTFVMPEADFNHPDFLITATLSNTDFLRDADEWQSGEMLSVRKRGRTDYVISANNVEVYFGVRDGRLYIASSEELANGACQSAGETPAYQAAKGKYLSASASVGRLIEAYPEIALLLKSLPQVREVTDALERLSLSSDTPQSIELSIETNKTIKELFLKTWKIITGKTPSNSPDGGEQNSRGKR